MVESEWNPYLYSSIIKNEWNQFVWLADWHDLAYNLRVSASNEFILLCIYPILGASYNYWVGQAALFSSSLLASYLPFLNPFHYYILYIVLSNVLFEIIAVILAMRLTSRYFGRIYASNVTFIFILLPIVLWVTICRWDMLPLALTVCTLYFAVENKPWYAWTSLTIAILLKHYPIIFGIPLLFYYFKRDGFKKTLIYVSIMITSGVLVYIPFILISRYGTYIFLYGLAKISEVPFYESSSWYWISFFFGKREKNFLLEISAYIQIVIIFAYVLSDYFYERKKESPLSEDQALIKRSSIAILLFMLTFKYSGFHYVIYPLPLVLLFSNCFKRFAYLIFWLIALHIADYLTIIDFYSPHLSLPTLYMFLVWIIFFIVYTSAILLIQFNKNPYENKISLLSQRDFMLGLYNFVKKIKSF
ncbi:MAG: glycosyltransferase 87 family protein [Promethearchaeota archaeon]